MHKKARAASKTKNFLTQRENSGEAEKLGQSLKEQVDSRETCSASSFPCLRSRLETSLFFKKQRFSYFSLGRDKTGTESIFSTLNQPADNSHPGIHFEKQFFNALAPQDTPWAESYLVLLTPRG